MGAVGWVKLHRSLLEHDLITMPVCYTLFGWCILKAAHADQKIAGQFVQRGQFITGRMRGSAELLMKPMTWYDGMKRLEAMGCISMDSHRSATVITVVNYDLYNSPEGDVPHVDDRVPTGGRQGSDNLTTHNKNERIQESSSEDKNPPQKNRARSQFSVPTVEQVTSYVAEIGAGIDPAAFIDHYTAKGWVVGKSPMKDWRAAVRTWQSRRQTPMPTSLPASRPSQPPGAPNAKPAGLLPITPAEATDPAAFDNWFRRQTTFGHDDRTRADMHAIHCSVARLFRRPEVAATQLQARLENLAAGLPPTDPPRAEDLQQAARDLAGLQAAKGAA